jgi:AraC family transcriptional regulator, positive regulator of tynA and feaB
VYRDSHMIRSDPREHFFLILQDWGSAVMVQNGQSVVLHPGDIFLADSVAPSRFVFGGRKSRQISFHLPRAEALERFGPRCAGGVSIDKSDPLHVAIRGLIARMLCPQRRADLHLSEALLGIVGAYFRCLERRTPSADRAADFAHEAALRVIRQRAADPDFDMDELAQRVGLSRRTLQRQFERHGDTVCGRIQLARFQTAWSLLQAAASEQKSDASIAGIVFDSGFNDVSYFYRAFRARYCQTPGMAFRSLQVDRALQGSPLAYVPSGASND